ncbi:tyrosine-type recombinase/integrase [Actinoplanes derwentensis]|uniref:tyrosine-type recombinase/integrase n=1 Tax=Actinoplanes derwentensis TaxID=113562 RepID=UPI0022B250F1|nr:tyrosine-type recombinase/integrase [Actinoplanes derwentensis]
MSVESGQAHPDNLTDRFNQIAVAAKVRPLGPHQIRHMLASNLLDTGYGIHEVAERLGHDPATLMRYYAKVSAVRRRQASDRIAELVTAPERQVPRADFSTPSPSTVAPIEGPEAP